MGALLRWRETAVIVLLVVVLVRAVLALGFGLAALLGAPGPYGLAAYAAAADVGEPVAIALLAGLAVSCHAAPVTARARRLTVLAGAAVAVAVLLELVVVVAGLTGPQLSMLDAPLGALNAVERMLGLVVPVLAALALGVVVRRSAPAVDEQRALPAAAAAPEGATGDGAEKAPAATEPDPALQPTWQPDAATGAVWLSAGDAASGRPPTAAAPVGEQDEPHPWAAGPR